MMRLPPNTNLPFFAYGLFRPGQIAFFQLRELVSAVEKVQVSGRLLVRDGLPIFNPLYQSSEINGALLKFSPEHSIEAYQRVSAMEPEQHYRWGEISILGGDANVLVGRSPSKGSDPIENAEWNGWKDPLFSEALDVVEETLNEQRFDWTLKPLFRLQMGYLLLWTSIERYVSLRYHLGSRVVEKIKNIANEQAFVETLQYYVKEPRCIFRADRPSEKRVLDPQSAEQSIQYYYQVRSNITHRGKGVSRDYDLLSQSLKELLCIFRKVLIEAENDAQEPVN